MSKEPDAEARFKELGEAYEVLKVPEKRAANDQLGANWKAGQDFRTPPGWNKSFEFRSGGPGRGAGGFSDFFEALFAGWAVTRGPAFGNEGVGFARLNIACTRSRLTGALDRLERAISSRG